MSWEKRKENAGKDEVCDDHGDGGDGDGDGRERAVGRTIGVQRDDITVGTCRCRGPLARWHRAHLRSVVNLFPASVLKCLQACASVCKSAEA